MEWPWSTCARGEQRSCCRRRRSFDHPAGPAGAVAAAPWGAVAADVANATFAVHGKWVIVDLAASLAGPTYPVKSAKKNNLREK